MMALLGLSGKSHMPERVVGHAPTLRASCWPSPARLYADGFSAWPKSSGGIPSRRPGRQRCRSGSSAVTSAPVEVYIAVAAGSIGGGSQGGDAGDGGGIDGGVGGCDGGGPGQVRPVFSGRPAPMPPLHLSATPSNSPYSQL